MQQLIAVGARRGAQILHLPAQSVAFCRQRGGLAVLRLGVGVGQDGVSLTLGLGDGVIVHLLRAGQQALGAVGSFGVGVALRLGSGLGVHLRAGGLRQTRLQIGDFLLHDDHFVADIIQKLVYLYGVIAANLGLKFLFFDHGDGDRHGKRLLSWLQ